MAVSESIFTVDWKSCLARGFVVVVCDVGSNWQEISVKKLGTHFIIALLQLFSIFFHLFNFVVCLFFFIFKSFKEKA